MSAARELGYDGRRHITALRMQEKLPELEPDSGSTNSEPCMHLTHACLAALLAAAEEDEEGEEEEESSPLNCSPMCSS